MRDLDRMASTFGRIKYLLNEQVKKAQHKQLAHKQILNAIEDIKNNKFKF